MNEPGEDHGRMAFRKPLRASVGQPATKAAAAAPRRHGRTVAWASMMPEVAAILGLIALVWVSIAILLVRERQNAVDAARNTTTILATAFEESTKRIITEIDQTLMSARKSYLLEGDKFDIMEWARSMVRADDLRVQIALMDRSGNEVRSTLERSNLHKVNIADRPHFRAQLDPSHDSLYISDPVVGRGSGEQTIQFTRKVLDQDGAFNGVFVLSLGCAQLSGFFDTSQIGGGFVALFNTSGVLLARGPAKPGSIGRDYAEHPAFKTLLQRFRRRGRVVGQVNRSQADDQLSPRQRLSADRRRRLPREPYPPAILVFGRPLRRDRRGRDRRDPVAWRFLDPAAAPHAGLRLCAFTDT